MRETTPRFVLAPCRRPSSPTTLPSSRRHPRMASRKRARSVLGDLRGGNLAFPDQYSLASPASPLAHALAQFFPVSAVPRSHVQIFGKCSSFAPSFPNDSLFLPFFGGSQCTEEEGGGGGTGSIPARQPRKLKVAAESTRKRAASFSLSPSLTVPKFPPSIEKSRLGRKD